MQHALIVIEIGFLITFLIMIALHFNKASLLANLGSVVMICVAAALIWGISSVSKSDISQSIAAFGVFISVQLVAAITVAWFHKDHFGTVTTTKN